MQTTPSEKTMDWVNRTNVRVVCKPAPDLDQDACDAQAVANWQNHYRTANGIPKGHLIQRLCGNKDCVEGTHVTHGVDHWSVLTTLDMRAHVKIDQSWADRVAMFKRWQAKMQEASIFDGLHRFDDTLNDLDNLSDEELLKRLAGLV